MDCYAPSHCCCHTYAHSPCCAQGPRRVRGKGPYFLPVGVLIDDDYETESPYLYPYEYHHPQVLPARRGAWLRRVEEEEQAFGPVPPYCEQRRDRAPRKERTPRKERADRETQQDYLESLAHRLEALELGLNALARVRSAPALAHKSRRGGRRVVRTDPAKEGFSTGRDPSPRAEPSPSPVKRFPRKESMLNPEEAAVIIQSRFRAYLVRRSQSLRHLRDLAMVKATLRELTCLFADTRYRRLLCRDPDERKSFSERATALLLKVDSVQGSDSMVREARRCLSKELVALLDSVDHMEVQVARPASHQRLTRATSDAEDVMANERDGISGGEMPLKYSVALQQGLSAEEEEEEEEMLEGLHSRRGRMSERGYFTSAMRNRNRHRRGQGPAQCRSHEIDAPRYQIRKACGSSENFGLLHYGRRNVIAGMDFDCDCSPFDLPY